VHGVATADLDAVSAAARGRRLYVPTFASPDDNDVIYRYDNALNTPSWVLAAARAAISQDQESHADTADETPRWHPAHPATNSLAEPDFAGARTRGPVERAIRALRTGDPILVLRAMTIDNAAQALIGQARRPRRQHDAPRPAKGTPSRRDGGTVAQGAAEDFPKTAGRKRSPPPFGPHRLSSPPRNRPESHRPQPDEGTASDEAWKNSLDARARR
jgi:hypothetical protein